MRHESINSSNEQNIAEVQENRGKKEMRVMVYEDVVRKSKEGLERKLSKWVETTNNDHWR